MPPTPPARPRNTQADRDFISAHKGVLRVNDNGMLTWDGKPADLDRARLGSPYLLPPADYRCHHERTMRDDAGEPILDADSVPLYERCTAWAILGAGLCPAHAGRSGGVAAAVRERFLLAADAVGGEMIALALDRTAADKDRLAAQREVLDRAGVRGGVELTADVPGWTKVLKSLMGDGGEESDRGADS